MQEPKRWNPHQIPSIRTSLILCRSLLCKFAQSNFGSVPRSSLPNNLIQINRYECYDKLFLTSLILNRLIRWLIPLFLTLFDLFYSYVALCHSWQLRSLHLDFSHLDSTQISATRYISFRLIPPRLKPIVVSLRLKLSLTLLWLNRFAKWFQPIVSRCHSTQSHSLHRISNVLRFITFYLNSLL